MPRWLLAVVFASACGFELQPGGLPAGNDGSVDGSLDGPRDSAPDVMPDAAADAPPDAPYVWTDIETLVIPCSGGDVPSTTVLGPGVMYRLRASGVCVASTTNNSQADAEWHYFNLGSPRDAESGVDNGIAIDDATPGAVKLPSWGAYSSTHVYSVEWTGAGSAITARYHDSNYSNNQGTLSLVIQALQ